MNASPVTPVEAGLENPYAGPRPFGIGEQLPNRQGEARELSDLVIAERVVLLHAPSGAGKTSLIQAGLIPILSRYGFRPVGPVRVDKPASAGVRNRYVHSIAHYLLDGTRENQDELKQLTLGDVLGRYARAGQETAGSEVPSAAGGEGPWVLLLDQFEEILILDPTDWTVKEQFFDDLREVLDERPWWVLFGMREDFMGGLDPYLDQIPGHLRTTYRLDFLSHAEADAAIRIPADSMGVTFEDGAVELLIERLAQVQVDAPDETPTWLRTPYVEPFQLQVASSRLWDQVRADHPDGQFSMISRDVIKKLDVDRALSQYYADAVAKVAHATETPEGAIRDWFESQLITTTMPRLRSQTMKLPVADQPDVVRQLEDAYLVRGDSRGGVTWYELGHDRLITAVVSSNKDWRRSTYPPWQIAAYKWKLNNRPDDLLLSKMELKIAPAPSSRGLTTDEQEFLRESNAAVAEDNLLKRHRSVTGTVTVFALAELVVMIILLIYHALGRF